jgi:hypothetical protein
MAQTKQGPPSASGPDKTSLLSGNNLAQDPPPPQASKGEERERWLFQIAAVFCHLHRGQAPRDELFQFVWQHRRIVRTHFRAGTKRDDVLCELIDFFSGSKTRDAP